MSISVIRPSACASAATSSPSCPSRLAWVRRRFSTVAACARPRSSSDCWLPSSSPIRSSCTFNRFLLRLDAPDLFLDLRPAFLKLLNLTLRSCPLRA